MRPSKLVSTALLCASAVSASWMDTKIGAALDVLVPHKRAPQPIRLANRDTTTATSTQSGTTASSTASNTNSASTSNTASSTGTSSTGTSSTNTDSDSSSTTGSQTGTATDSSSGTSSTSTQTSFANSVQAGGIAMVTPSRLTTEYYKIGDYVTFAWNYTSLKITPTAVDILAACATAQTTYTLALNQTVDGSTGAFLWDTSDFQVSATQQLLTATYTLIIHDAQKEVTAAASPGYLSTYNSFTFGMYSPQAYTPLADYVCVTCSGALSALERQSMAVVGIMATGAVLGATWFTSGFSLL